MPTPCRCGTNSPGPPPNTPTGIAPSCTATSTRTSWTPCRGRPWSFCCANDADVVDAIRAGARGYLTKDADRADIARALHAAAAGLSIVDPRVHATLLTAGRQDAGSGAGSGAESPAPSANASPDNLTEREVEILALVVDGPTNPEIAARLYLSVDTVKSHINRVFAKTGSRDRAAAINYAHRRGLVR